MQIDSLGALALLVRLDLKSHTLAFVQGVQARPLDRRDMDENITPAIVGFYKPITPLRIKEFDCSLLRHGTHSSPSILPGPAWARQCGPPALPVRIHSGVNSTRRKWGGRELWQAVSFAGQPVNQKPWLATPEDAGEPGQQDFCFLFEPERWIDNYEA